MLGLLHHIIPASTDWTQSDYKHPEPPEPLVSHFHHWLLVLFFSWLHTTIQHSGAANLKKTAWTNCKLYMALLGTFVRPHRHILRPQDLGFDFGWIPSLQVTVNLALKWLHSTCLHGSNMDGKEPWNSSSALLWMTESDYLHFFIRGLGLQ